MVGGSVGWLGLESGVMPGSHSFIGQCRYGLLVWNWLLMEDR